MGGGGIGGGRFGFQRFELGDPENSGRELTIGYPHGFFYILDLQFRQYAIVQKFKMTLNFLD